MKISFITTVFNEEKTIEVFIKSIFQQSKKPDEIIIIDGGSSDQTAKKLKKMRLKLNDFKGKFAFLVKEGNRSVGRNEAIRHATGDIIVCSDAGNILDKEWIKNIIEPFQKIEVDVVAGYYQGLANDVFQKCLIPYVLIMSDKVNLNNFLPATRSIAFTKKIWQKVGGFNEKLSHNEDYALARALQKANAKIVFKKDAIAYWMPRSGFKSAYGMLLRFAYGDAEAKIWRPKVIILFMRYAIGILLLFFTVLTKSAELFTGLILLFTLYLLWAIWKNYKYVKKWQAIFILPLLQLTADYAVLKGTIFGVLNCKLNY